MDHNSKYWTAERFFQRLDYFLEKRNMSLHELSGAAETGMSSIYQMRRRKTLPNLVSLCFICDALCISLYEFFATDDELTPEMHTVIADMHGVSVEGQKMLAQMVKFIK